LSYSDSKKVTPSNKAAPAGARTPGRGLGHHLPEQETAVSTFNTCPSDHDITPVAGSARRVRDGEPADLTRPAHYPVEAVCMVCGQPVRCERWLLSAWYHLDEHLES
jgi:hypothetical protein